MHKQISTTFIDSWNSGINANKSTFLAQFSPTVEWYDHAFFIRHQGLGGLARFRTQWLISIKDFRADVKAIEVTKSGTYIQCVYHGIMVGNLPGRPASGKTFQTNVLILLHINEDGKIEKVDEYYTATLDQGVDTEGYSLMNSEKSRTEKL